MTTRPQAEGAPQPARAAVPLSLTRSRQTTIRLSDKDDVVVACYGLTPGDRLETEHLTVLDPIPSGHKVATRAIASGAAAAL